MFRKRPAMTNRETGRMPSPARRRFLALCARAAAFGALAAVARRFPAYAQSGSLMGLHYLGATYWDYWCGVGSWPQIPLTHMRIWDVWDNSPAQAGKAQSVSWGSIHKAKGAYDWSLLDRYLALLQKNGVKNIVYTFGYAPKWARSDGSTALPPDDPTIWRQFVRALVTRYKGRITAYGIWNEPNAWPYEAGYYWKGTPAQLASMGSCLYRIVKSVDPNALVLSPETQGNGAGWMQEYLAAPGGRDFDVYAVHYYGGGTNYVN